MPDPELNRKAAEMTVPCDARAAHSIRNLMIYRLEVLTFLSMNLQSRMEELLTVPKRKRRRVSKEIESLLEEAGHLLRENICDAERLEMMVVNEERVPDRESGPVYIW